MTVDQGKWGSQAGNSGRKVNNTDKDIGDSPSTGEGWRGKDSEERSMEITENNCKGISQVYQRKPVRNQPVLVSLEKHTERRVWR